MCMYIYIYICIYIITIHIYIYIYIYIFVWLQMAGLPAARSLRVISFVFVIVNIIICFIMFNSY